MAIHINDDRQRALDFLQTRNVGVLATVDDNNHPSASALYYTVDKELNIFFVTKTETLKHHNLQNRNNVMMVVHDDETQSTVQIKGVATDITSDEIIFDDVIAIIFKVAMESSDSGIPPIEKLKEGSFVGYKIKPSEIRMAVYARPDSGDYDSIFETIKL